MAHLNVDRVSVDIEGRRIVNEVVFSLERGQFLGLVGPNGSGKTSLLRAIYRVLAPRSGRVEVAGDSVWALSPRDVAKRLAVVAQERMGEFDFTVSELVGMGRTPHKRLMERDTASDFAIVEESLRQVGMLELRDRQFMNLSGGEKQRALVARALAQQAEFLVLDEPTNHLDIRHQLELLELVRSLGVTTIAALHDLSLAARYCDALVMMKDGCVIESGSPQQVLTAERIEAVYGVRARLSSSENGLAIEYNLPGK
ncbi:ABC transporter ATP-binding protein [Devosia pacifica]|nr:ABC transporter ATP-binding protein [Devosia pacifica]